ncbi:hypothetical protein NQ317_005798 [Molorchus minor]|uniref:Uncharacterized protein n=1 Tax=Molorchus minor TaxID=1323400 RepID=A0ABQ9JEI3_9CUCU|nr:hypothetical protein NQ317_005798 [Molorchus minor]
MYAMENQTVKMDPMKQIVMVIHVKIKYHVMKADVYQVAGAVIDTVIKIVPSPIDLNAVKFCQNVSKQSINKTYEELEYGYPNMNHAQHNGARYLFISASSAYFSQPFCYSSLFRKSSYSRKKPLSNSNGITCARTLRSQPNECQYHQSELSADQYLHRA